MGKKGTPSFLKVTLVLMVIVLGIAIGVVGLKAPPNITILATIGTVMLYAVIKRCPTDWLHEGIINGIKPRIIPIFIFILIGPLIAVWIQAGITPTLMVVGFKLISVQWFVPSVSVMCVIVGSAVGSTFTVMPTIGIAFFGIGTTLGLNPALVVGAIVSGAVFGDRMSPLSESTNLAAAIVDVDLFEHIKHMIWSTIPTFVVSFFLPMILGHTSKTASLSSIREVIDVLEANFTISIWSLIPLFLMLLRAWKKVPATLAILLSIAVTVGMIFIQSPQTFLTKLVGVIESGFVSNTGNQQVDSLLSREGIESMMPTVSLIILISSLGGLLIEFGLVSTVVGRVSRKMTNTPRLIFTTSVISIGVDIFIGEQFLSVILPDNAFKETYEKAGFDPTILGRTLEDGGTIINYLVPWGIAGSFVASTFGTPTLTYLPFVFFSLLSLVFSMVSAFTGWGISRKFVKLQETVNRTAQLEQ